MPLTEAPVRAVAFDVGHTLIDESIDAASFELPVRLMPHVREALPEIDVPMAAWSNTKSACEADVRHLLEAARIAHFFTWITTSIDAGWRKPHREFFDFALKQCGFSRDEVLFVGNQLNTDVYGGTQCQIRTVWVAGEEHRSPDETMTVRDVRPDFVVASLAELPELIRRLR
jgi:FMN phosphatase YigB (HAD superfamily)